MLPLAVYEQSGSLGEAVISLLGEQNQFSWMPGYQAEVFPHEGAGEGGCTKSHRPLTSLGSRGGKSKEHLD